MGLLHDTERHGVADGVFRERRTDEHEKSCDERDPGNSPIERRRRSRGKRLELGSGVLSRSMSGRVRHETKREQEGGAARSGRGM
jgi:hypothetical protein